MGQRSATVAELLVRYEDLHLSGSAPPLQEYAALHNCPPLIERMREIERLRAELDHLAPAPDASEPPPRVEGFRLLRPVGYGSSATVWAAEQEAPRRICALKMVHATTQAARERFGREADLAARLCHTGIARVYAFGAAGGELYLATELAHGFTLQALLQIAALSQYGDPILWLAQALWRLTGEAPSFGRHALCRAVLSVALEIAEALAAAHAQGVVHRDIKPANVVVGYDGRIKLIDFGIAVQPWGQGQRLTRTGDFVGSLAYAAPEQLESSAGTIGPWTDTYELGATLFEMLTQRSPFEQRSLTERRPAAGAAAPRPRDLNPRVPAALDAVVARALEPEPARRFRDGAAIGSALQRVGERLGPLSSLLALRMRRLPSFSRLVPALTTLAALALGILYLVEHLRQGEDVEAYRERELKTARAVLTWALSNERRSLDDCIESRPVPRSRQLLEARLIVSGGVVQEVEVLPGSLQITGPASRCMVRLLRGLTLPGVGLHEPVAVDLEHEFVFPEAFAGE